MAAPNSTHGSNAVYRADGVRLYGMDAEIELKQRAKRDPQLEKELSLWIEKATGEKLKHPDDLIESLRSGVLLCKLINTLLPGTIKAINTRDTALHHMENIGLYLKACWKVGVDSSDLFVASDLYLRKGVPAVIQNLASIARCSHSIPEYKGPTFGYKPNPAIQPAKKWDQIKIGGPVFVTDIEDKENTNSNIQYTLNNCNKCGHEKICQSCNPSQPKVNIINEKEKEREKEKEKELMQQLQKLNQLLKEKEDNIKSLNDNLEKQKKKFIEDEKSFKELIENQKTQLQSKENIIQSLNKTNSNLVLLASNSNNNSNSINNNTPLSNKSNSYISPSTTTATTASSASITSTSSTNANKSNRNSGVFQAVSAINNKTSTSSPSTTTASSTATLIKCTRCNSTTNKPTQKYCSCGELLKKDTTPTTTNSSIFNKPPITPTITTSTPSSSTVPSYLNRNSVNITTNNSSTNNNNNNNNSNSNSEIEKLNDRIKTLCTTMKQQEETISKLNNQINLEKQGFEKEKKQQKQIIDNQQFLLNQKEQDLKKVLSSISSASSSTTTSNVKQPFLLGAELKSINSNNFNKNEPSIYSKPYGSTSATTTTIPPNSTIISNKELEQLREKLLELENSLNNEISKSKVKDSTIATLNEKILSFNNRPKRVLNSAAGATRTSQIVVGRKRFNTLKPDSQDITNLIDTTLSHLTSILYNKSIEFYQVTSLKDLFSTETGRRRFSQILSSTLKQVPQLQLSESNFELLLYLISCALQEMNLSKDNDFQSAKIIFNASDSLYRADKNGNAEYLKSFITSAPIFKETNFWNSYYWIQLSKRHRKCYGKIPDTLDRDIIINLLSYFGVNMIYFGISSDQVKEFINDIGSQHNLDKTQVDFIISNLKDSPLYQSINTNNNEKDKSSKSVTSTAKISKKDEKKKK